MYTSRYNKETGRQQKILFFAFFVIFFAGAALFPAGVASAASGINKQINYQGILRDSAGALITDGTYDMVFVFYTASSGGSGVATSTHTAANGNAVTTSSGIFDILLGSGTGNTISLDFTVDEIYVGISVGSDAEMTPRQRVGSSISAFTTDRVFGTGQSTIGTTSPFANSVLTLEATSSSAIPFSIRGYLGQIADLFQIVSSTGSTTLQLTANGALVGSVNDPVKVGGIATADSANDVFIQGKYAYVVTITTGDNLEIFDISRPTSPTKIGGVSLSNGTNAVYVAGSYAYIASGTTGDEFEVVDVSNPSSPVKIGGLALSDTANALYVGGKYAYVVTEGAGDDLVIIDISDPANPVKVSGVDLGDSANGIYVSGKYAYIVRDFAQDEFVIYDISSPASPVLVGSADLNTSANDVYVSGRYAYVVSNSLGDDFEIFDVSNPASPSKVGGLAFTTSVTDVYVAGNYAYITTAIAGDDLEVYDISNPASPTKVGGINLSDSANAVYVSGKYAYVVTSSAGDDLEIFDISGIDAPSANIGDLLANTLDVTENANITNNLYVGSSINVGFGGLLSQGAISIGGMASSTAGNLNAALYLASSTPATTTLALYQQGGTLFWNGAVFAAAAGGTEGQTIVINSSGTQTATSTLFISSAGNVGIGNTSPTYNIDVTGLGHFTGLVDASHFVATSTSATSTFDGFVRFDQFIDFDEITEPANPVANILRIWSEDSNGKTFLKSKNSDGVVKTFALDSIFVARNTSGATIPKGKAVFVTGATGGVFNISLAKADTVETADAEGVTSESIPNNGFGLVAHIGDVKGLDTSIFTEGDDLFLSTTTAGDFVNFTPVHPDLVHFIGRVAKSSAGAGIIHVNTNRITQGVETGTISNDFHIGSATGSQAIQLFFENAFEGLLSWTPTANRTITIPDAGGTMAVSASGNVALSALGDISFTGTLGISNGGTGTTTSQSGGIFFSDGTTFKQDSVNLFWDDTNNRLGIGTTSPFTTLSVAGSGFFNESLTASNITATGTLSVTGAATLANASSTDQDLSGYLVVSGQTTLGNASTTNITASGYLNITGQTTLTNASTTNITASGYLTIDGNSTFASATSTNFFATTLGINSEYFTDLTGVGLTLTSGALTVATSTFNLDPSSIDLTEGFTLVGDSSGNASATSTLFISSAGNVGIGTTSPSAALAVNGALYVTASTTFNNIEYLYPSADGTSGQVLSTNAAGGLSWTNDIGAFTSTNGTTTLTTATDVVAIGTTTASYASSTVASQATLTLQGGFTQVASDPVIIGGVASSTALDGAVGTYVSGRYAYVTNSIDDSLRIIDVSDPTNPSIVGGIKDATNLNGAYGVYVSGRYAYVTNEVDDSLRIIDVSDPTNPSIVGGVKDAINLDTPRSVYVSGRYAYVANLADDSLRIIDVSDPTNPSIVGGVKDAVNLDGPRSVYVSGRYAYMANQTDNSLRIIDVSDPTSPSIVGGVKDDVNLAGAISVYVSGRYAYVVNINDDSLRIIDVSDPTNPSIVGGVKDATNLDAPLSVYVSGRYAYVTNLNDDSLRIIDVSDPTNPSIVAGVKDAVNLDSPRSVYVSGRYAYVVSFNNDSLRIIDLFGSDLPTANIGSLQASSLNVSENVTIANTLFVGSGFNLTGSALIGGSLSLGGTASTTAGQLDASLYIASSTPFTTANALYNNGGNLFFNGSQIGLAVSGTQGQTITYDATGTQIATSTLFIANSGSVAIGTTTIAQASSTVSASKARLTLQGGFTQVASDPVIIGGVASSTALNGAASVHVVGSHAYVVNDIDNSLRIIDISNPTSPRIVGGVKDDTNLLSAASVYVSGKYAYVANRSDDSLRVIDISDSTAPIIVGGIKPGVDGDLDGARSVYVSGSYAYVAARDDDSLRIIDVSDPTNPSIVGGIKDAVNLDGIFAVRVSGKYAYVVNVFDDSLRIIDISDPTSPSIVGGIKDAANLNGAIAVYVSGKYAYVANNTDSSLRIIDVSDPTSLSIVGGVKDTVNLSGITSVYVSGKYAYVTNNTDDSVRIIDISDPTSPSIVGGIKDAVNLNGATSVYVSGKYAYVANNVDDSLRIVDLGGIDSSIAHIGNIASNNINISENLSVGNALYIRNSLNVGSNSLFNGSLALSGFASTTNLSFISDAALYIASSTPATTTDALYQQAGTLFWNGTSITALTGTQGQTVTFDSAGAQTATSTLFLTQAGNVGIGTTTPVANLVIVGTTGQNLFQIATSTNQNILIVDADGNVGVGTTSPWRTFSVTGTVAFSGLTSSTGDNAVCITTGGEIVDAGGATCALSSEKFKENILTLDRGEALNTISQLRVVSFDYKEEYRGGESPAAIGMIAEEVELIDTRLVDYDYEGRPLTLHFERITGLIVQAIQEQQEILSSLQATIQGSDVPRLNTESGITVVDKVFEGDIIVRGHATFGEDTVGQAKILAGDDTVNIVFREEYKNLPIITLTPQTDALFEKYYVGDVTTQGFRITIDPIQTVDVMLNWHAFGGEEAKIYVSDGTVEDVNIAVRDREVSAPSSGGSNTDTEAPVITIAGNNPAIIDMGADYTDLGATFTDNVDDNLGIKATVNGVDVGDTSNISIDTGTSSTHTIIYSVTDNGGNIGTAERIVIVGSGESTVEPSPEVIEDTTAPIITLIGEEVVTIFVGESFTDEGATAQDETGGDLTSQITTTDNVDTSSAGSYTITYSVSDGAGNSASTSRSVIVEDYSTPDPAPEALEPDPIATTTDELAE